MGCLEQEVDVRAKSGEFAGLVAEAQERLKVSDERLTYLTGVEAPRLERLRARKEVFRAEELQLLGVVLGIGLDQLFPLDKEISDAQIHQIFEQLQKDGIGIYAAACRPEPVEMPPDQASFERAIVHLHYIAECLNKFPHQPRG